MASTDEAARRLAPRLTSEMAERGLIARDLVKATGRTQTTVWRWMNGESLPDHASIERLETALGVRRGTVYRWAGLIDDGGLVDLQGIGAEARRSVLAILQAFGEDIGGDGDH